MTEDTKAWLVSALFILIIFGPVYAGGGVAAVVVVILLIAGYLIVGSIIDSGAEERKREWEASQKRLVQERFAARENLLPHSPMLRQGHLTSTAQAASKNVPPLHTPSPKEKRAPVTVLVIGTLGALVGALIVLAKIVASRGQ